jgi:hypothetical protein
MKYSSLDICEFAYVKGLEVLFFIFAWQKEKGRTKSEMLFNVIHPMSVYVWANAELDYSKKEWERKIYTFSNWK